MKTLKEKQVNAEFFTPKVLADTISEYTLKLFGGDLYTAKILEPSGGDGALLISLLHHIKQKDIDIKDILNNCFFFELCEKNIENFKENFKNEFGLDFLDSNIYNVNTLLGVSLNGNFLNIDKNILSKKIEYKKDTYKPLYEWKASFIKTYHPIQNYVYQKFNQADKQLQKICLDYVLAYNFLTLDDIEFLENKTTYKNYIDDINNILSGNYTYLIKFIESKVIEHKFFHFDLEFNFKFDIVVSNPPWKRKSFLIQDLFGYDKTAYEISEEIKLCNKKQLLCAKEDLNYKNYSIYYAHDKFDLIKPKQPNLYKYFNLFCLEVLSNNGVLGIIQPSDMLFDEAYKNYREKHLGSMRYLFCFTNDLKLFSDVNQNTSFSLQYFTKTGHKNLQAMFALRHPATIKDSFAKQISRQKFITRPPKIKDYSGNYNLIGHSMRIIEFDDKLLKSISLLLKLKHNYPPILAIYATRVTEIIKKLSRCKQLIKDFVIEKECVASVMFDQTASQKKKYMIENVARPKIPNKVILSSPMIYNNNPCFKESNNVAKTNADFDEINLSEINDDFLPKCKYSLNIEQEKADSLFPILNDLKFRDYFRIGFRDMVQPDGERSSFVCIIPTFFLHINSMHSIAFKSLEKLIIICGISSSILSDKILKILLLKHVRPINILNLPYPNNHQFLDSISRRTVSLNCLTTHYDEIWRKTAYLKKDDKLLTGEKLTGFGQGYNRKFPLRDDTLRTQAMCEIDVLTALSYNLCYNDLEIIYLYYFNVLQNNDKKNNFDRLQYYKKCFEFFEQRGY